MTTPITAPIWFVIPLLGIKKLDGSNHLVRVYNPMTTPITAPMAI